MGTSAPGKINTVRIAHECSFKIESTSINHEINALDAWIKELNNIPNDQYNCTECNLVPEILALDFHKGMIEFECPNHGHKTIEIDDYFKNESKYLYINYECTNHKNQKNSFNDILNYCLKCSKYYCFICSEKHDPGHKEYCIKVNELNNKCKIHCKNYHKYCKICKNHICNEDKINCQHEIKDIKKSNDKDIEKIKNKIAHLKKNIVNENYYIKLLNTLIISYERHPSNYFHNINISNVTQKINDFKYIDSEFLLEKINNLEKRLKSLNFDIEFNPNQLKVNLNGKTFKEFDLNFLDNLDYNLLSEIKFTNLEEINLSNNKIEKIEPLKNLESPKLKKIDLSHNKIKDIIPFKEVLKNNLSSSSHGKNVKFINLYNNLLLKKDLEEIKNIIKVSGCENNKIPHNYSINCNCKEEIENFRQF